MGKNDQARLPTVNKIMFDNGNWQAFTAVINYIADLTVWAATTKEKGTDGKKYNLLWLLPRDRDGPEGRGMMDDDNFPLHDTEAHRNCHATLYRQLYFNLNGLVPDLVAKFPITDYDSEDPNKGYIDEKYTVATDLLWAFKDKYNKTSADTLNHELENITKVVSSFPGYPQANSNSYHRHKNWNDTLIKKFKVFKLHPMAAAHEVALVTKLIGAITKVEVNPTIAHPLPFSPVIQEMDTHHENGNQPDLLYYLSKLDTYILRFYERTQDSEFNLSHPSAYMICQECFGPHDIKDCTKVKKAVQAWDSNMLSNHSSKGRTYIKGGRGKDFKQKGGQDFQGHQAYKPPFNKPPFNKANFKPPYPNKFNQPSNSSKQPWKKQANFINNKRWARGGKPANQGARGNYKGKPENFDPDYHKRVQANHVAQQPQPAIMPPPYMYQANAALPPLAPRVHFNPNPPPSNHYALNTEILQPPVQPIFSHNGRFNANTDVFNENGRFAKFSETINGNIVDCMCIYPNNEIYVKLDDNRDTIDRQLFSFSTIKLLNDGYNFETMIVTFQKGEGLDHDTDDDEYETSHFHRSRILNYHSSVIKDQSYANGHFKEGKVPDNNFYSYDMYNFDMIKSVAAELSKIGLTQNKEVAICLAINYMASINSCYTNPPDITFPFDYSTRFSRIVNPMWATDMYKSHGQDAKVEHYLQPHFMDGYIKKDDYIYITTGYLQFDKYLLDPLESYEDSSDEEDDEYQVTPAPHLLAPPEHFLHEWRHSKYRVNLLIGRQLKQFIDIITMNGVHHTEYEHARVLDVHFIKYQHSDDSSDSDSGVAAASAKRQRV